MTLKLLDFFIVFSLIFTHLASILYLLQSKKITIKNKVSKPGRLRVFSAALSIENVQKFSVIYFNCEPEELYFFNKDFSNLICHDCHFQK